jgi:hypothetical protein
MPPADIISVPLVIVLAFCAILGGGIWISQWRDARQRDEARRRAREE